MDPYAVDLFPGHRLQYEDIEYSRYADFNPVHTIVRNAPIEIIISKEADHVIDFARSEIRVEARITDAAGAAPLANTVGPCNNLLHSMFKTVKVYFNGTNISGPGENYHYRAYFEDRLSYAPYVYEHALEMQMWHNDDHITDNVVHGENHNTGLVKRAARMTQGRAVTMIGRLHSDVFTQMQLLIPNIELKFILTPNDDNIVLQTPVPGNDGQVNYQLHINSVTMHMQRFKLSPTGSIALDNYLYRGISNGNHSKGHNGVILMPIKHCEVRPITIPPNIRDHVLTLQLASNRPSRITMGFVSQASFTGSYQASPFNMAAFNVKSVWLRNNGEKYPATGPIKPDFATGECTDAMSALYEAMHYKPMSIKTIPLTMAQFREGSAFYSVDLTKGQNSDIFEPDTHSGNIELELSFTVAPTSAIYAIVYAEYDKLITIDHLHNILANT